ncbi:MAG: hypothetical protein F6K47_01615 [Symploca sp. SIO2E6]|nr:hypothetical protein [Symploca sp. SIO2E6]
MAVKDRFHDAVKHGLQKEQWKITHDPLKIEFGEDDVVPVSSFHWQDASSTEVEIVAVGLRSASPNLLFRIQLKRDFIYRCRHYPLQNNNSKKSRKLQVPHP